MLQVMGTSFYVRGKLSKEQKYGGCGSDSTIFVSENMILLFWQVEKTILLKRQKNVQFSRYNEKGLDGRILL